MSDTALNLILLPVFAALVGLIFWLVRRHQAAELRAVQALASERGWTLEPFREPLAWGLRLKTSRWTLEATSRASGREHAPGSSDVHMSTRWQADAPGPLLFIGGKSAAPPGLGGALAAQALRLALGEQAASLSELEVGSEALRARYLIRAQEASDATRALTPAVEAALIGWQGPPPLIRRDATGLGIELAGVRLKKPAELGALVALGEALLGALSGAR